MKLKIFLLASVLFILSCSNSSDVSQKKSENQSNANTVQVTPNIFVTQIAEVKGEYSPIKIADNLKDSVEQQELPKIWLEFDKGSGEILKTELYFKVNENLASIGKALLRYRYIKENSKNPDEIYNAAYNHSLTFGKSLNEIRKLETETLDGKRKLTEEEIDQILTKQAELINDRYFELDDHFKPKSAFYKFKESINEKFGYQIF